MNTRMTLAIIVAVISAISGAAASGQLDPLMSVAAVKAVGAITGLIGTTLASVSAILSSQGSQNAAMASNPVALSDTLKQMPGVEGLTVNKNASPELAALAMSPDNNKIAPKPGQETQVESIAQQHASSDGASNG